MKIALCLFKYFPYGGMQRDFLRIALMLSNQHSVEIFTTIWQSDIPDNFSVNFIKTRGFTNHQRMKNFAKKTVREAKKLGCKFIIGFNKIPGLDIYFAADNCYVKAVEEKHGLLYRLTRRYRIYSALEKSVFSDKKVKILILAAQQKMDYQQIYKTTDEQFYLLPPEFSQLNLDPFDNTPRKKIRQLHGIKKDEYIVLMVCSAFKTKGVDRTLEGLQKLDAALLKKTHLWIIGGDSLKPWLKLAKQLKVDTHVEFFGAKKNVLEYMCAADIFLHPARQEAAGKVILEAISCGLPVLTTEECGYAEHVLKADAGIVLPKKFEKYTVLAEHLAYMLKDDERRSHWKKQAIAYAKHYPICDFTAEAVKIIQTALPIDL